MAKFSDYGHIGGGVVSVVAASLAALNEFRAAVPELGREIWEDYIRSIGPIDDQRVIGILATLIIICFLFVVVIRGIVTVIYKYTKYLSISSDSTRSGNKRVNVIVSGTKIVVDLANPDSIAGKLHDIERTLQR
jgi:hypothetical protein